MNLRYLILLYCIVCLLGCNNPQNLRPVETEVYESDSLLEASPAHLNLGVVSRECKELPFCFSLKNKSNKAVAINKVDVTCGCVVIDSYPEILFARKSDFLRGRLRIANQHGYISKPIFVCFNKEGLLMLRVQCKIIE